MNNKLRKLILNNYYDIVRFIIFLQYKYFNQYRKTSIQGTASIPFFSYTIPFFTFLYRELNLLLLTEKFNWKQVEETPTIRYHNIMRTGIEYHRGARARKKIKCRCFT